MNQRPPLYSEKKVQVCFIKMDDPEPVNFAGVGVFPNHEGGYLQPPIIGVGVSDGVVEKVKLALKEELAFQFDRWLASRRCFVRDWEFFQQCFVVAEVHSTGAGSGSFSPHFHSSHPFPLSDC